MSESDELTKCMHSAVNYLSRREHSVDELEQKLGKKEYSKASIEQIIARLIDKDYLSNIRYAEMLIRTRQQQGYGKRYVEQELVSKGVDSQIWQQIDNDVNRNDNWRMSFQRALAKKCHNGVVYITIEKNKFDNVDDDNIDDQNEKSYDEFHDKVYKQTKRIMSFLSRRGFGFDEIKQSVDSIKFIRIDK